MTSNEVQPLPTGPRITAIAEWVDLPADSYPGFRVRIRSNFPQRLANEIASGDAVRAVTALRSIVLEHNGWCDEDGEPLPLATDEGFWEHPGLPTHLAVTVLGLVNQAASTPPNLGRPRNGR